MADEQKKLHPDCWKRKRSLSSANNSGSGGSGASPGLHGPGAHAQLPHSLPHTPNRLTHPFSFLTGVGAGAGIAAGTIAERFPGHPSISVANGLSLISAVPNLDQHSSNR